MSVLEKDIEIPVCNWAKKHGFLTPKVKFAEAGWPDRLFISPIGHTIFIEFKRPPFKPDRLQEYRLAQLRQRGIPAYWVDSIIEGINILKAAVEPARIPNREDSGDNVLYLDGATQKRRLSILAESGVPADPQADSETKGP